MNYKIKLACLLIVIPLSGYSLPDPQEDHWVCKAHDNAHLEWTVKGSYQKIALNLAFEACKKQSKSPISCKISPEDCEGFHLGSSTKPYWRCAALDSMDGYWPSNYYRQRDDAIYAAKAYCKSKSSIPETCYVNVVTCANVNEDN